MNLQPNEPFNPQASVEQQLQILSQSESQTVKAFASETLESWCGRCVSSGDIANAIDRFAKLVENGRQTSPIQSEILTGALKALQETGSQIQKIDSVAKKPLGLEPDVKLESALATIDQSTLPSHPAYHSDWSWKLAASVLKLPSVPIGSYVLIGHLDYPTLLVKEMREQVSTHSLTKAEGKGFTIQPEENFYYSGSESEYEEESPAPPAILSMLVTPLGHTRPQVLKLLHFKEKLENVTLSIQERTTTDWKALQAASEKVKAQSNRPQLDHSDAFLKSAVDVIDLASDTAIKLERDGHPIIFHGNTVKVSSGQTFICHQMPTDHSRDDLWLSLWETAGSNPLNNATIIKLSTPKCPLAGDIPIIREYTPLSEEHPAVANFERTCTEALAKLDDIRRIQSLEASVSKHGGALKRAEEKLGLEQKEEELEKLEKDITYYKKNLYGCEKELSVLKEAIKQQKTYIKGQLEDFLANKEGSGPHKGLFTTEDGITVKLKKETKLDEFPGAIVRRFTMEKSGEESRRTVTQIDYPHWADFSASSARTLISLRDLYQTEHKGNPAPAYVHCRAGVGRTGTFAVFCGIMDQIERAAIQGKLSELEPKQLLFDTIVHAREQRNFQIVQTPAQGQQIIEALKESLNDMIQKEDTY